MPESVSQSSSVDEHRCKRWQFSSGGGIGGRLDIRPEAARSRERGSPAKFRSHMGPRGSDVGGSRHCSGVVYGYCTRVPGLAPCSECDRTMFVSCNRSVLVHVQCVCVCVCHCSRVCIGGRSSVGVASQGHRGVASPRMADMCLLVLRIPLSFLGLACDAQHHSSSHAVQRRIRMCQRGTLVGPVCYQGGPCVVPV